jgi:hypothetical protein
MSSTIDDLIKHLKNFHGKAFYIGEREKTSDKTTSTIQSISNHQSITLIKKEL